MFNKLPFLPILALLIAPFSVHAVTATSQEREYDQVRTIALRDPKVRAAYAEADRKLEEKILKIDPALASYVRRRSTETSTPPSTKPAPNPANVPPRPFRRAHTVVKGDTLGSIAAKYGVTVAALKTTNRITDEKKLPVGQVIAIPNGKGAH
jgi:LysM repeat protein